MKGWNNCPRCGGTGFQGLFLCQDEPPKGRRYIAEAWASFEARCMHPNAGEAQRREMRGAFYAGAMVLFSTMQNEVTDGDEITEGDMSMMEALDAELQAFGQEARERARAERAKRGAK